MRPNESSEEEDFDAMSPRDRALLRQRGKGRKTGARRGASGSDELDDHRPGDDPFAEPEPTNLRKRLGLKTPDRDSPGIEEDSSEPLEIPSEDLDVEVESSEVTPPRVVDEEVAFLFDRPDPGATRAARDLIADAREKCNECRYRRVCVFAPVSLAADRSRGKRTAHPHRKVLKRALLSLMKATDEWESGLLHLLAGREKDALLAGCILAEGLSDDPELMARLVAHADARYEEALMGSGSRPSMRRRRIPGEPTPPPQLAPEVVAVRMVRGQVMRAAALVADEGVNQAVNGHLRFEPDDEGRLHPYETAALLTRFVQAGKPAGEWVEECEAQDRELFRATVAVRDTWSEAEDAEEAGALTTDLLFPYRRGGRRTYLYLRRNAAGESAVVRVDNVRIDSFLKRVFLLFKGDERKTWRIFKEVCRHLNVRVKKFSADQILQGFDGLEREDLMLLGLYAPVLARAVGSYLEIPGFDTIVKFLYRNRTEGGRRGDEVVPAHVKVFDAREGFEELREVVDDEDIKDFFKLIFRLNEVYVGAPHTANTYYKLGEVAYLLTVLVGWNAKGVEIALKDSKPLGFIAYGMQPECDRPERLYKRLNAQRRKFKDREDVLDAISTGIKYMALIQGWDDPEEFIAEMDERLGRA